MVPFKDFPTPIKEKFVSLIISGVVFWLVGICVALMLNDSIMFILSLLICLFSLIKAAGLYMTALDNKYEVVKGTCVSVSSILIRKQKKIKIADIDGNERTLLLSKHAKISVGTEYNFYFKSTKRISLGNEYFDSVLSSDCFLGYEEARKRPN